MKTAVAASPAHFRVWVLTFSEHLAGERAREEWEEFSTCLDKATADLIAKRAVMTTEVRECDGRGCSFTAPLVPVDEVTVLDDHVN
ncbi:hypothetical protein [Actinomadura yumaensis]|uniref:Uncharacterized protein n=1 Tax=Actinomadura yumaensis TaxID=111807 RepID=A0ABW2CQY7_9ACTN